MIISNHVRTVDDQYKRRLSLVSSCHSYLFQFVEGTFDVQKRARIPWTSNAKKTSNVAANDEFSFCE